MKLSVVVNRETASYLVFGVLTSILNIGLYEILLYAGIDFRISNLIALLATKIAAYILNKLFVFRTDCSDLRSLCREFFLFTVTRGGTMLLDWFGLILMVSVCKIDSTIGKLITTFIVVVLNYVLGKKWVFVQNKRDTFKV